MFEEWFFYLPPAELDLPLIVLEGVAYTPRDIYPEVMGFTPLSRQMLKELKRRPSRAELEELAVMRLLKLLEMRPVVVARLTKPEEPEELTPEELREEVIRRTPFGLALVENEIRFVSGFRRI